ncbi:NmrA family NAD(P)-binding protein [Autumnicola musiva]|uniref:NmrA family NAD(P)-binding protein n=1 Tax=Autumnicola musiva TaxID=3075589 RepID=A0ABU3D919_9FLAO|nr:NmrA family NAD(P)-binding protein [Zunongwangia sp. F117]MDT0677946.1 NmrA family NAD(P)-binding protein [Zunongwangia sp. F117]
MKDSILIIGTGELGIAMISNLNKYVTANNIELEKIGVLDLPEVFEQDDKVLKVLKQVNADPVPLNLKENSIAELANVIKEYDTVISCSGFSIGAGMQIKITKAVLKANIKKYIPWQFGVDYDKIGRGSAQPLFDEQLDVRDLLRQQNSTNWIILSVGMITSFLFREDFGVIRLSEKKVNALGDWQNSLTLTSCDDIGKLTITVLFHKPEIIDEVVFVSGETLTFKEIADRVEEFFNFKIDRVLWDENFLKSELAEEPDDNLKKYRLVFTDPGVSWPMSKTFNFQNDISTLNLNQWMKENFQ